MEWTRLIRMVLHPGLGENTACIREVPKLIGYENVTVKSDRYDRIRELDFISNRL